MRVEIHRGVQGRYNSGGRKKHTCKTNEKTDNKPKSRPSAAARDTSTQPKTENHPQSV